MPKRYRKSRMSDVPMERLLEVINTSQSYAEILRRLGFKTTNKGQYEVLRRTCQEKQIDLSHLFTKGEILSIKAQERSNQIVDRWLAEDPSFSAVIKGWAMELRKPIRRWLLDRSAHKCEQCGWNAKHPDTGRSPLQIHHVDGDASHNHPDNLKVLCPNCHSLTPNFGSRNVSKRVRRYADKT